MLLDIIIPQYKESSNLIKRALDSISCQLGVDFKEIGIIMINDHSDVLVSDEFKTLVKDKSIDEVYNIIDITLRDSYGLVDCSLDKDALSKTSTTTNHYGFGGFSYENK